MIISEEEAKNKFCVDSKYWWWRKSCIASECMAWRWKDWRGPLDGTEIHVGYCGKAGIPTTPWKKP